MGTQCEADELVGSGVRGGGGRRGREEVHLVRGVERIREGKPGTERLVIGRVNAYVAGFECCDVMGGEIGKEKIGRVWDKSMEHDGMSGTSLTRQAVFLWHVILCKEREFEAVQVYESVAEGKCQGGHTTGLEMATETPSLLSLHER